MVSFVIRRRRNTWNWLNHKSFINVRCLNEVMASFINAEEETDSLLQIDYTQSTIVNKGTDDEFSVHGYEENYMRTILFYILSVLSVGTIYLLGYWYPIKRMKWTHDKSSLKHATVLLIQSTHGGPYSLSNVEVIELDKEYKGYDGKDFLDFELTQVSGTHVKYFEHMFLRYFFNQQCDTIHEFSGLDQKLTVKDIYEHSNGIAEESLATKLLLHGKNFIDVPFRSSPKIFLQLSLKPLHIFQIISLFLWSYTGYWYYGVVILAITFLSVFVNTYYTKKYTRKVHEKVAKDTEVNVLQRDADQSKYKSKPSRDLVPGDVIVIPTDGMHIPCDAVLLNGRCIVNESSLTGESFSTTKTSVDSMSTSEESVLSECYSVNKHKRHTLYNGTDILQAHFYGSETQILAVVIRTGFCTLKGSLIRSIIHPKQVQFTYICDSFKFIALLACSGLIGFAYSIVVLILNNNSAPLLIIKAASIFTTAIPPSLPAIVSVGLMFALSRLRQHKIFCIDPERVNSCGKVKLFVFDKTGTLTEDSLTVSGIVPVKENHSQPFENDPGKIEGAELVKAMATCHRLIVVKDHITGDPLDQSMFNFTTWSLREPTDSDVSTFDNMAKIIATSNGEIKSNSLIAIIKQYPFESSLQRMSVITKEEGGKHMTIYTKGSPEMIMSLCWKDRVPNDMLTTLMDFTRAGCRVIAIASKQLGDEVEWHHLTTLQRSEVECELNFLGLIIFENVLKPKSKEIIETLYDANIRTVMATGDNLYTAATVAREVGIITGNQTSLLMEVEETNVIKYTALETSTKDLSKNVFFETMEPMEFNYLPYSLVLTGSTYMDIKENFPRILPRVLMAANVYARMSPDQKTLLIEDLKELGYGVGMCGDGANDCGALKAAHAGIALSDTEASVASPFTSKVFDISCVPQLLKEGRAALVLFNSTFKFVVYYSYIQYIGVILLISVGSAFSNVEFLYEDLFLGLLLAFLMLQSKSSDRLSRKCPKGRLIHPIFVIGFALQILIQFVFQLVVFKHIQTMPWYRPPSAFKLNRGKILNYVSYESTAVVLMGYFQYLWMAALAAGGKPHLRRLDLNWKFLLCFVFLLVWTAAVALNMPKFIQEIDDVVEIPNVWFLVDVFAVAIGNLLVSYLVEKVLMPSSFIKRMSDRIERNTKPRKRYKLVYEEMQNDENWSPNAVCTKKLRSLSYAL